MKLLALVGPTAVGKTALSIALAQKIDAEIISCDSMQVYRGMDIGTAKATVEERQDVPHHLIDIVDPDVNFTVADYQRLARQEVERLNQIEKPALLVGGTGLYYQALVDDFNFFPIESRDQVRKKWETIGQEKGLGFLFEELMRVDEEYARKVGPNDRKRMIRALEVWELTGEPFSRLQLKNQDRYQLQVVGLCLEREQLYRRIETRVDMMMEAGLVEEIIGLRQKGYGPILKSMNSLGYKQVNCYLDGMLNYQEMLHEIKRETRHFAKRQLTWFRKDQRITWMDVEQDQSSELLEKIHMKMAGHNQQV
ncbi:MAG TPA: tRNA (adenosine(37)-N6)-dimethylallyltransferase MiaA [Syntrophomonas sp.]|nr:tRNA (adenosine(37)-N6)-dimethylallyltransferase MiaA [Syntrophomonas sp.]